MKHFDNINNYINGRLSNSDKIAFEKELALNTDLKQAVEEAQLNNVLEDILFVQQAKDELKSLTIEDQSTQKETRVVSMFSIKNMSIAASFLVLITAGVFLFNSDQPSAFQYDDYYNLPLGNTVRGDNNENIKLIENGFVTKDWATASSSVAKLENKDLALFFSAHIAYNQENYSKAIKDIDKITSDDKSLFQKAEFLKVLCLLKSKKLDDAKMILNEINSDTSHYYNKESKEILTKLFN